TFGLHRFVWDLTHPGPWDANPRRSARNGPMVLPGTYTVRLRAGGMTDTQPLVVRSDPRVLGDGVDLPVLSEQLVHNLCVRDLVTEVNVAVARVQAAAKAARAAAPPDRETLRRLGTIESRLTTPSIRYSRPGLQAQIQYLYSASMGADQRVGRDARVRYQVLRSELDSVLREMRALAGDPSPGTSFQSGKEEVRRTFSMPKVRRGNRVDAPTWVLIQF
ncbi:MAG: hypothetical protein ABIR58_00030, partial [Gemmatimonadaceae bacterium]